jgi:hypothetical protein
LTAVGRNQNHAQAQAQPIHPLNIQYLKQPFTPEAITCFSYRFANELCQF